MVSGFVIAVCLLFLYGDLDYNFLLLYKKLSSQQSQALFSIQ